LFGGLRSKITSLFKKEEKIAEDRIKESEQSEPSFAEEVPEAENITQPVVFEKTAEKKVSVSEETSKS
jgi:hypothetical protein